MVPFRERLTRLFFGNFFRLLLVAVSLGEWACVVELLRPLTGPAPTWSYFAGSAVIYVVNRYFIRRPQDSSPTWKMAAMRAYSAFAFTCIFGSAFLLLHGLAWGFAGFLVNGVSLAAGNGGAVAIGSPVRDWTSWLGLAGLGLLFLHGYTRGQGHLTLSRYRLPFARAGKPLDGLRIVQISDIHLGRYMPPHVLAGYVEEVNRLEPDVVVITGDIVDSLDPIPEGFPVLARLKARHGVFAILGNHDFYAGADEVAEALRRLTPFTVLRDDFAAVEIDGARLYIAGVDDLGRDWARGVQEHPALTEMIPRLPQDGPVVLLSHRPDLFPQAAAAGIDLVLSGHTHGGQMSLPRIGGRSLSLARFITPYDRDLYREGESWLYVNRGLGCTGQRIRIFTPRDIGIFEIAVP